MPNAKPIAVCGCPVAAFQKMISGKYKLRIVWDLKDGPRRYSEIRSGLLRGTDGTREIAPRVLSRELKALTQTGLIDRRDFGVGKLVSERRHDAVECCALDRDWPVDAEKQDFGDLARVAIHPFGAGQGREYAGQSGTRRLVTGCTAAGKNLSTIGSNGRRGRWRGSRGFGGQRCGWLEALVE